MWLFLNFDFYENVAHLFYWYALHTCRFKSCITHLWLRTFSHIAKNQEPVIQDHISSSILLRLFCFQRRNYMTPVEYFQRCQRHSRIKKARQIVEHCTSNSVGDIKQKILFKQETGFMPQDYLDRFDNKEKLK